MFETDVIFNDVKSLITTEVSVEEPKRGNMDYLFWIICDDNSIPKLKRFLSVYPSCIFSEPFESEELLKEIRESEREPWMKFIGVDFKYMSLRILLHFRENVLNIIGHGKSNFIIKWWADYDDSHGDDEIIVALGNPKPVKDEYGLTDDWKHIYIKLPGETSFTRYERCGESAQSSYGLRNAVLTAKKVEVEETASNEIILIYDDMNMLIQFGYNHSSNFHFLHRVQKDKDEIISKYPFGKFPDDIVSVRHIIHDDDFKNFFIEYEHKII